MVSSFRQVASAGFSGTVGAVTGLSDLVKKYKPGSSTRADLADVRVRPLAITAVALDALSVTTQTIGPVVKRVLLHKAGKAVSGATHIAHFNKVAGYTALGLQIGAGLVELGIACRQKNAERASNAVGSTVGSLSAGLAGAKLGAVIGSVVPGPGTALGGVAGAVVGSWGGAKFGQYCTDGVVRHWLSRKLT